MRPMSTVALTLFALAGLGTAALAQGSTGAPAGTPGATAPGGTEGAAALRNEREAVRSGDAIPAPPGIGIPAETVPPAAPPPPRP
ncbi:hypothetical protein [Methylobacterium gossipiicola]|uniref:Uncharacterized protein n=1 Tax=Methylobacterium gossipiicola TaxID=582675 RepID=A0A1I2VPB1_9HYPH|nr:hypothetical protein [Methylobacterium gossipiicola]SFG89041.1 hypothetical protein SAMN05192565_11560 [Methylobacterium gossipiicola]